MAQINEVGLNWWARMLKNSPLVTTNLVQALVILYIWGALQKANDALLKCREEDAVTRERILNQSSLNTMKADNIYNRTELLLSNQKEILEQLKNRRR